MEDTFDCPLVELDLISEFARRKRLPISSRSETLPAGRDLSPLPFLSFGIPTFQKTSTLTFANIAYSEKSPGRTFQLDEDTLAEYLDRLESLTDGALRYDETAGMKQVYRNRKIDPMELLQQYYRSNPPAY